MRPQRGALRRILASQTHKPESSMDNYPNKQNSGFRRNKRKIRMAVHFSRQSDEWATPDWYVDGLRTEFPFTLDPCANHENHKCSRYFTEVDNGLLQDWGTEYVFCNPPYSEVGNWMEKAYASAKAGATVVCLVPSRTDTRWWHSFAMKGEVRLLVGRLRFGNSKNSAPFPSALVIFRPPTFKLTAAHFSRASKTQTTTKNINSITKPEIL
jgi:phage N-6-adenine-methyltransferase